MWVTAYVDASYRHDHGGGWSIWLRSELGRHVTDGKCEPSVRDSLAAEFEAIIRAVEHAREKWPSTSGVLIRSDCEGALFLADANRPASKDPVRRAMQERLRKALTEPHKIRLRLTWVKSHRNPKNGVAAYLNNQVDKRSRKARQSDE